MKTFLCKICGHTAFNEAPVDCPVCFSAIENFENNPDAIKVPVAPDNLTEFEREHIPVIHINRECITAHRGAYTEMRVKVGRIDHVMESEHFIKFMDVYIDRKYITRIVFTPKRIYPSVHLHLIADTGVLSVISHCNVHGSWRSKINLDEKH